MLCWGMPQEEAQEGVVTDPQAGTGRVGGNFCRALQLLPAPTDLVRHVRKVGARAALHGGPQQPEASVRQQRVWRQDSLGRGALRVAISVGVDGG